MKIALVVHDFDRAFGQGRYSVELAERLARAHDVHIFANTFGSPLPAGQTFWRVPAWRRTALSTVTSFIPLAERQLRREDFDIIHSQGMACWHADVITSHICNAAYYQYAQPVRLSRRIFPFIVTRLERRFYRQHRARHLIAVSRQCALEIRDHYGWQRETSIIFHGTDTAHFHPPDAGERAQARRGYRLPETAWVWLFMGEASKGLAKVIEQLPYFPDATLLVISRSNLGDYAIQAEQNQVQQRVVFWGPENQPERAFHAADVFVYPSPYDTFGMVLAEAMATALPVIAGNKIGCAELIADGQNGSLCDPKLTEQLREKIAWIRANPEAARTMGKKARATIETHSWDRCAAETLRVYERVLTRGRAA